MVRSRVLPQVGLGFPYPGLGLGFREKFQSLYFPDALFLDIRVKVATFRVRVVTLGSGSYLITPY